MVALTYIFVNTHIHTQNNYDDDDDDEKELVVYFWVQRKLTYINYQLMSSLLRLMNIRTERENVKLKPDWLEQDLLRGAEELSYKKLAVDIKEQRQWEREKSSWNFSEINLREQQKRTKKTHTHNLTLSK